MFTDAENVEADLVGELNFFKQILHTLDRPQAETRCRIRDGRREAIDADLHLCDSRHGALDDQLVFWLQPMVEIALALWFSDSK
jgi:hypothetical protein